jgi:hypothetical protein
MNDNLKKFYDLWGHVNNSQESSECILEIKIALEDFFARSPLNIRPLIIFADRIGKHLDFKCFRKKELVAQASGEWHVTNSDLKFWADLCLFGERDIFPTKWNWFSSSISNAIHRNRRWQTLQRYYDKNGLNEDHKKLLSHLNWNTNLFRGDGVSLYVQGKRPFGNSYIECDIIEILGWKTDPKIDEIPADLEEKCWELFDELQFAIVDLTNESL